MKIAILGTGRVGGTLGRRWAGLGHEIVFGSRDAQGDRVQQLLQACGKGSRAGNWREAAEQAEVILLATPWNRAFEVLEHLGDLAGKVLIDCSNPLTDDFRGLAVGFDTSAAEEIAARAPGARVVKAFNTVGTASMENPDYGGQRASMFYCGDDDQAKEIVRELTEQLGLEAVNAGPLHIARYLEPLAMLYIHLVVREGWGSHCAFKVLTREKPQ